MTLEIVLNELSLKNPAPDINTARKWMSDFINTLRLINENAKSTTPYTHYEFYNTVLAPNYSLSNWLYDREIDRDDQRLILTLTNQPFTEEVNIDNYEFSYEGESVIGLGVAYLLDALLISILSEPKWDCTYLSLKIRRIDENEELLEENRELPHISCSDHLQEHTDWIQNRIKIQIYDGVELWKLKEELFPRLEFCDSVGKQLQNIKRGQLELKLVREALSHLDSCCQNWTSGSFSSEGYSIEISPESTVTLNQYSQERTFRCPDGQERLFEQHIKLRVCNWRIHFYPKEEPGKVIIGYIGRHLPTDKYPT